MVKENLPENVLVKLTLDGKEGRKLAESLRQDIPVRENNVAQPAKVEKSSITAILKGNRIEEAVTGTDDRI